METGSRSPKRLTSPLTRYSVDCVHTHTLISIDRSIDLSIYLHTHTQVAATGTNIFLQPSAMTFEDFLAGWTADSAPGFEVHMAHKRTHTLCPFLSHAHACMRACICMAHATPEKHACMRACICMTQVTPEKGTMDRRGGEETVLSCVCVCVCVCVCTSANVFQI